MAAQPKCLKLSHRHFVEFVRQMWLLFGHGIRSLSNLLLDVCMALAGSVKRGGKSMRRGVATVDFVFLEERLLMTP